MCVCVCVYVRVAHAARIEAVVPACKIPHTTAEIAALCEPQQLICTQLQARCVQVSPGPLIRIFFLHLGKVHYQS